MASKKITVTFSAEIPEGATLGEWVGNAPATPESVGHYLTTSCIMGELAVPGVEIDGDSITVTEA